MMSGSVLKYFLYIGCARYSVLKLRGVYRFWEEGVLIWGVVGFRIGQKIEMLFGLR